MTVLLKNNAFGFLATSISATDVTITLQTGNGGSFPAVGASEYFYATIQPTAGASEIVKVTARSNDVLTVVRAQEGTSALSFAAGSRVELRVTAQSVIDAIADRVSQKDQASEISIADAGNYYVSTNVEGALQEAAQSSTTRYVPSALTAVARSVQDRLRDEVNVFDFMTAAQIADVRAGTLLVDVTAAVQACMDYARTLQVYAYGRFCKIVFPPGYYKLSAAILLPFGFNSGTMAAENRTMISGYGAKMFGSGSRSTDHDCFVSAYWDGTQNVRTLGTAGETHPAYGVTVEGFGFENFRRCFELQNWNQGCAIRDIYAMFCQSVVYMRRCFYTIFENITGRGAPQETGCYFVVASPSGAFTVGETITGGTTGKTAVVQRWDSVNNRLYVKTVSDWKWTVGETVTGSVSGQTATWQSEALIGTMDVRGFVNISPLRRITAANSEIGFCVGGADGAMLQDCGFEGARYGFLMVSECTILSIYNAYMEGCEVCAMYFIGLPRAMIIQGCWIYLDPSAKFINMTAMGNDAYVTGYFNNNRYYAGDFTFPPNLYGHYVDSRPQSYALPAASPDTKVVNMSPAILVDTSATGYNGSPTINVWDHSANINPGFYRSVFGDNVTNILSRQPFQTRVTGSGTSPGTTKWTFTTQLPSQWNFVGTWYLRFADIDYVRNYTFLIIGRRSLSASVPDVRLVAIDAATGLVTDTAKFEANYSATIVGGKLVLIADDLAAPALVASIVRMF